MTGKMSLVVLRSWSDCPPKVRAIAPPDDDRSIIIEPDHNGRFNEISQNDPRFQQIRERTASAGAILKRQKSSKEKVTNSNGSGGGSGGGFIGIDSNMKDHHNIVTNNGHTSNKNLPLFLRRKTGQLERNLVNRHSYGGFCDNPSSLVSPGVVSDLDFVDGTGNNVVVGGGGGKLSGRSISSLHLSSSGKVSPVTEGLTIRPGSAGSPDHPDGSSLEYTPPSSPVAGRYRNLGPELAATIPKRTIKSSWITGIKSRWMKSTTTTHPESAGRLKSYSSSPSLVTAISPAVLAEGDEELLQERGSPFFNPLYKFDHHHQQQQQIHPSFNPSNFRSSKGNSGGSSGSSSGIALDDDSQSDRSRSSLSNPVSSYSPSPPPILPNIGGSTGILRQQIVYSSSRPNGLQKYNSLTDFSEEDLYSGGGSGSGSSTGHNLRSLSASPYGLNSSGLQSSLGPHSPPPASDVVLVEVIRKPDSPPRNKDKVIVEKRHSVGEVEPIICNKFAGVKVEGSPGKVARIKESIRKFGRFGRNHSEKILRFQSDEEFISSPSKVNETSSKTDPEAISSDEVAPKPAVRRSKAPEQKLVKAELKEESEVEGKELQVTNSSPPPVVDNRERNRWSESDQNDKSSELITETKSLENGGIFPKTTDQTINEVSTPERKPNIDIPNQPITTHHQDENGTDDPLTSIFGDQDRSMSTHIQSVPTIDIQPCVEPNHHINSSNRDYSATPVIVASLVRKEKNRTKSVQTASLDEPKPATLTTDIAISKEVDDVAVVKDESDNGHVSCPGSPKEVKSVSSSSPQEDPEMLRRLGVSGNSNSNSPSHPSSKILNNNNSNGKSHVNPYASVNGQVNHAVGIFNGNGLVANHNFSSPSFTPDIEEDDEEDHHGRRPNKGIGHGRYSKNHNNHGVASVQVPVQAINRNVVGYGVNSNNNNNNTSRCSSTSNNNNNNNNFNYANSVEDDRGSGSAASSESRSDSDWQRSSTRASFRGFCEGLLQDEKISLQVPEVVEASINFDIEDSSSLDPDEERENSVEYISIADVKVNHERQLDRSDGYDGDPLPNCVISLDIGSRGSGYSYWIKEESDCVRIGNVDSGSSCPKSHKAPSWVSVDDLYLDLEDEDENGSNKPSSPGFGYQALDKFLTDDTQSQILWKWRETFNDGAAFPYTLESKPSDEELMLTMKSAIRHYGRLAFDQVDLKRRGGPLGTTVILVAIPSNFDSRARKLVREAAFGAGLVTQKDAVALIEDPCAAGIYAYHAIKSKIAKSSAHGTCYLSVDIGGAYLHSSGYETSDGKLHQVLSPKSEPLVDSPESIFEAELSSIFTPSFIFNYQNKYKAGWLKLMTEFEKSKNLYDPLQRGNYYVFVPSSFVDHFRRFTSMEVEDALESSDILWSKVGALGIPFWKMQRFIQPLMDFIRDKIINLVKKHNYEYLVLTGGRAGLRYLVEYVKNAVRDFSVEVAVPKEYNAAVLQGSTISLTNLAPRLIIKSPFGIGVGVMTPFIEDEHPEEKRVLRDGKSWCADVWDSLIKVGQDLELNRVILKRSYVGAQPGQSLLILPLFKSPEEPKFVTQSSVQKCCEFKFNSGQRAWQEVELIIKCRPSELLITALDGGVLKNVVVVDFAT